VLAKAYAGFGLGVAPARRVATWQQRARALAAGGIQTSTVYAAHDGILFVEYVGIPLLDRLRLGADVGVVHWAGAALAQLAAKLDILGVAAVSLLPDIRCDAEMVYLTDFGEDLGDVPGSAPSFQACTSLLRRELVMAGFCGVAEFLNSGG